MNMSQDNRLAWLALYMIPGLGNTVLKRLIDKFDRPEAVFDAGMTELMGVEGVRRDIARKIMDRALDTEAEDELRKAERCNARIVAYTDPAYPPFLREIHNPPMLLYVKGKEIPLVQTFVGVVGSRHPTHYGRKAAEKIGLGLARRGAGVVSGLAIGIDSAAHRGCLRGNGFTIDKPASQLDGSGNMIIRVPEQVQAIMKKTFCNPVFINILNHYRLHIRKVPI